jgi:hypothetical protein
MSSRPVADSKGPIDGWRLALHDGREVRLYDELKHAAQSFLSSAFIGPFVLNGPRRLMWPSEMEKLVDQFCCGCNHYRGGYRFRVGRVAKKSKRWQNRRGVWRRRRSTAVILWHGLSSGIGGTITWQRGQRQPHPRPKWRRDSPSLLMVIAGIIKQ